MARNKRKIIRACTVSNSIGFFEEVVVRMKDNGYEPVVVSSSGRDMDDFKKGYPNIKTIEVPMKRRISIWKDIISLIRMIRVFMKEKPYIVHSMTPKAGFICMTAAWLTRVPVRIHTFTGLVWPTATGKKRKILMLVAKILCACATHVNPEGQGVLNDLKNGRITKKPMKVLGFGNVRGVDLERFDPKRFKTNSNDDCSQDGSITSQPSKTNLFTFLFVGRIVTDKGINELVEAFMLLHDKYENTRLVLVGDYEGELDPLKPITMQRIEGNTAIDFCGSKYGEELVYAYMDADCFVMPSYREGFPNTVLEAGAMGLPSIVTDINGSREIIMEGENGLIIPPRAVEPLHVAMERMLMDKEIREKMQMNARSMIESRFEKHFVQECLLNYYNEVIK